MGTRRRPRTLIIQGFIWKIVYHRKLNLVFGETDYSRRRIEIYKHDSIELMRDTLWHEAEHALFQDLFESIDKIPKIEDKEEQFVKLSTPRLIQFVRDNPEFIEWIQSK
jgi:hypothetical protein